METKFRTVHEEHAIEHVVMKVTTKGHIWQHELETLQKAYRQYWQNILPKMEMAQLVKIDFGPRIAGQERQEPLAPTRYAQYGRDGNPVWWMALNANVIEVVCREYSNWKTVSHKAHQLLALLGRAVGEEHLFRQVQSVELTYQDCLIWEGRPGTMAPEEGIQKQWIPAQRGSKNLWHSEQGWAREDSNGETWLERWNIGAIREADPGDGTIRDKVRILTTGVWGFGGARQGFDLQRGYGNIRAIDTKQADGRSISTELHARTKDLFGSLITEPIARKINLFPEEST